MNPIVLHWVTTNLDINISRNKEIYQQCLIFFNKIFKTRDNNFWDFIFVFFFSKDFGWWIFFLMNIMKEGKIKVFSFFNTSLWWRKVVGVGGENCDSRIMLLNEEAKKKKAFLHYSYLKSLYYSCLSFRRRSTEKNMCLQKSVHDKIWWPSRRFSNKLSSNQIIIPL